MKTKFIVGMVLATAFSFSAMAAGTGGKVAMEATAKHIQETRKALFGQAATSKGIKISDARIASEKIAKELGLTDRVADFKESLSSGNQAQVEARLETGAAIASAKIVGKALKDKGEAVEADSLLNASAAMTKTLMNSKYTDTGIKSKELTDAEMKDVSSALLKLEGMGESVMKMNQSDRDMYSKVEIKRDEILQKGGNIAGEEALIRAIMETMNCDKTKALEIARKLKECV